MIMDGLSNDRSKSINVSNVHLESYGEIAEPYKAIYGTISARDPIRLVEKLQVLSVREKYKKCPR